MKPRSGAVLLPFFAAILGAWWLVLLLWDTDPLPTALLGGSAAACLLTGVGLGIRRAARRPRRVRPDPDLSFGAVVLAFGIAGLVLGAEIGLWLILMGAGATVLGLALLGREWLGGRAVVEDARRSES